MAIVCWVDMIMGCVVCVGSWWFLSEEKGENAKTTGGNGWGSDYVITAMAPTGTIDPARICPDTHRMLRIN
jgi:hypothetical protein